MVEPRIMFLIDLFRYIIIAINYTVYLIWLYIESDIESSTQKIKHVYAFCILLFGSIVYVSFQRNILQENWISLLSL